MLACSPADFQALGPRLSAALPKTPLLYGGEDAGASALQAELEARPDIYLATAYSAEHLTESGRSFAHRYEERFHEAPDLHATHSYDAVRLLCEVMHRAGAANKDAVVKEVSRLEQFDAATGPIRWKDHQPLRRVFLVALKNNQAKVVRIVEPEDNGARPATSR